jgi:hypothetical protein
VPDDRSRGLTTRPSAAAPLDEASRLAAEPVDRQRARTSGHEQEVRIDTVDELVEFFIAAGKKGVAINRYKGLGEMNPEQLWSTTMKPESRTLLQVRAEDHAEADQMFTTLMGDQVEPGAEVHRRQRARREEPRRVEDGRRPPTATERRASGPSDRARADAPAHSPTTPALWISPPRRSPSTSKTR